MSETDLSWLGTTVVVWAHPDDETYLSGGTAAALVDLGHRVVAVTATRGDAGGPDVTPAGRAETARLRTAELEEALRLLGVAEHIWLDYEDGGCADADPEPAVRRLASLFDDVRPDSVLSFGPDGFTGHPDHQTVSGWVDSALARSAAAPRLLHAVGDRAGPRRPGARPGLRGLRARPAPLLRAGGPGPEARPRRGHPSSQGGCTAGAGVTDHGVDRGRRPRPVQRVGGRRGVRRSRPACRSGTLTPHGPRAPADRGVGGCPRSVGAPGGGRGGPGARHPATRAARHPGPGAGPGGRRRPSRRHAVAGRARPTTRRRRCYNHVSRLRR